MYLQEHNETPPPPNGKKGQDVERLLPTKGGLLEELTPVRVQRNGGA